MSSSPKTGPLQPGDPRRLGRWRIVGRLGSGGMGLVYLGVRRKRYAALKVLRSDLARDDAYRERFRREAEAASRVASVNTARVLEIHDAEPMYLATEYIAGPTLSEAIAASGPLRGSELRDFARGVAHAIAATHVAGVTHRDLTPANVILDGRRPVVIDFGIARADDNRTMTATGWAMGTPGWMAPEQARGERVGPPADVFAWGLLVVFAGTGRPPFGTGRADAVVYRIVHETPDLGGLDYALAPIVIGALEKDPHRRPRPEPVLHELMALDSLEHTAVAPPGIVPTAPARSRSQSAPPEPTTSGRFSARRAVSVIGVVMLLVAAGVGGVWLAQLGDDETAAADPESAPTPSTGAVSTSPPTVAATSPPPPTTREPVTDSDAYCEVARDYYDRLDDAQSDLGLFPDQDEVDDAFLEFAAENQDFGDELRATAPDAIADDIDVIVDAFELAGEGDLSGYDSGDYESARDDVQGYEILHCGIVRLT